MGWYEGLKAAPEYLKQCKHSVYTSISTVKAKDLLIGSMSYGLVAVDPSYYQLWHWGYSGKYIIICVWKQNFFANLSNII